MSKYLLYWGNEITGKPEGKTTLQLVIRSTLATTLGHEFVGLLGASMSQRPDR